MFRIEFSNSREDPIYIQVDPWACVYELRKGERMGFFAEAASSEPEFSIDEYDHKNRILTLWNCNEFFIVRDGVHVHWTDFPTNVSQPEQSPSSAD